MYKMEWVSLQRMLNLDSDDEIIIEEDDKSECILCKYTNHEFLDHLYYTLCGSTSKNNMYTTLFDTFDKRMKELDRQGFESHKLKIISYTECV